MIALAAALAFALSPATAQVPDGPIRLQGSFVTTTDAGAGTKHVLEITVEKYSSSNDRVELVDAMIKGGQDAARSRMQRMAFKGRMRVPDWTGPDPKGYKTGWELRYIWREPMPDGGTRIVIGTDRPLKFEEAQEDSRTLNYPFTFVEIHLPKTGTGEGRANGSTRVVFDKDTKSIQFAQYSAAPVMLTEVTAEAKK
jgi:hypothetical protein